ncbi:MULTISPECIES: hypothetical protein [unclassified Microcoleus]|uniref:hypothetical protein n=1 Tax=unclassified Microcoleus TaxID=2642155 RepID=UPI002FD11EDC
MEHPNIYTFKHSELPPMTDGIESEIKDIEREIGNTIQKFEGHYRALSAFAETLAGSLNDCEEKMHCIRIIPDGGEPELLPKAIELTDLPLTEKQLIVSTALTSSVAIEMLAEILDADFRDAAFQVRTISQGKFREMSSEEIEQTVQKLAEALRDNPEGGIFAVEI